MCINIIVGPSIILFTYVHMQATGSVMQYTQNILHIHKNLLIHFNVCMSFQLSASNIKTKNDNRKHYGRVDKHSLTQWIGFNVDGNHKKYCNWIHAPNATAGRQVGWLQ